MRYQSILFQVLLCLVFLGFCTIGPGAVNASEVTVDASLSHLSFPLNQAARLTVTVSGTSHGADIELPVVDNLRLRRQGTSSRINVINGSISSSISHNYLVQAEKSGPYTIPPIKVTVGGETYSTRPLSFQVTAAGQSSGDSGQSTQAAGEIAFIRISQTSGSHYPGELVPLTIKAYFNQAYRTEINSRPTLNGDGVVMSRLPDNPEQTEESVNGRMYHVLTWQTSLSGIKVGEYPLHFSLEASVLIPRKRRSLSPFGDNGMFDDSFFNDPAFDSFFGGHQQKSIVSVSPEIVFNVIPLPTDNQPDNFTGAIGDFNLKVAATPVDVEVGEPMTLTMEISGTGNFDRVEAPKFPESADWKTYSPSSSFSEQGRSYRGTKSFEQAVVAKTGAVTEIPPLSFSYFNPAEKRYITKTSEAVALRLKTPDTPAAGRPTQSQSVQAATPAKRQQAPQAAPAQATTGLAPIHLEIGTYHHRLVPLFKNMWLIAVCSLCVLLLLTLFVFKLRRHNIEKHPEIELKKRKKLLLANDLKRIEQAKAAGDAFTFLTLGRSAIQNQLGLLWSIEPAALSLADIRSRLQADSPLIAIFQAAEEAAYGGATLTIEKMQNYFTTLKTELEELL